MHGTGVVTPAELVLHCTYRAHGNVTCGAEVAELASAGMH